jgi:hypothetical protein
MQVPTSAVPGMPVPALSTIIAHVVVLSVALERLVEVLKGIFPFWPFARSQSKSTSASAEHLRSAAMIVITAALGTGFCWIFRLNLLHVAHVRSGYIAAGLAAAAGAAFWHNLLGLMRADRTLKDSQAATAK